MSNDRREKKDGSKKKAALIWALLILGFCAIEFPGILFVKNRVYPFLLGMPFLYGYAICCWAYMVCVFFYAWRTRWGRQPFFVKKKTQRKTGKLRSIGR